MAILKDTIINGKLYADNIITKSLKINNNEIKVLDGYITDAASTELVTADQVTDYIMNNKADVELSCEILQQPQIYVNVNDQRSTVALYGPSSQYYIKLESEIYNCIVGPKITVKTNGWITSSDYIPYNSETYTIQNNGTRFLYIQPATINKTLLNCGETTTISAGYTDGMTITANSLSNQTSGSMKYRDPANASTNSYGSANYKSYYAEANQTFWVNGHLITGEAPLHTGGGVQYTINSQNGIVTIPWGLYYNSFQVKATLPTATVSKTSLGVGESVTIDSGYYATSTTIHGVAQLFGWTATDSNGDLVFNAPN